MMKKITINIVMLGPLVGGIDTANLNRTFVVVVYIGVVEARGTPNPEKANVTKGTPSQSHLEHNIQSQQMQDD